MKKIVLLLIWYGKFRNYFEFWLKSIEYNPSIDFILITDQTNIINTPKNLKIINISFVDLVDYIQSKFDFPICVPKAYKLCDFRPAFGYIFEKYINEYDFWGHCDEDLIFGDIRKFITNDILDKYDKILRRGHFSLYRNTDKVNSYFKKIHPITYKKVFSSPESFCFDETNGIGDFWYKNNRDTFYDVILFDDIDYLKYNFHTVHKKQQDRGRQKFIYVFNKGKLFRVFIENQCLKKEEIMYVHFQKRILEINIYPDESFIIIPNKFLSYENNINISFLKNAVKHHALYFPYFKFKYQSLLRKINKIKSLLSH